LNAGEQHHPILWFIVLVAAIVASVVATVIDNVIKGEVKRAHNALLLFNECLAEQHSVYLVFFIALATGSAFTTYWGSSVLPIALLFAVMFYVKGIYLTTVHSEKIAADHACAPGCKAKLKRGTMLGVFAWNLAFALILFVTACFLVAKTTQNPTQ